jgi:hypothetical protein
VSGPDPADPTLDDAAAGRRQAEQDPHSPTTAGPDPGTPVTEPIAVPFEPERVAPGAPGTPAPDPTPVVGSADATHGQPAGSALLDGAPAGAPPDPHPEKLVGAAFAGGLVAAVFLRRLANRKHR